MEWLIDNRKRLKPVSNAFLKTVLRRAVESLFHPKEIFAEMNTLLTQDYKKSEIEKFIYRRLTPKTQPVFDAADYAELAASGNGFDLYIVGSDQVWRPRYAGDPEPYFFSFLEGSGARRISYAASFGAGDCEYTREQRMRCGELLAGFEGVSVREDTAVGQCREYFGCDRAVHVLDPAMLLTADDYRTLFTAGSAPSDTLYCYLFRVKPGARHILQDFAERHNLRVVRTTDRPNAAQAAWLNQHGYKKKKRQNNTLDAFAASFIKGVLDNPVYCGKLAYGRRKNEKVSGTRNEYRIVKQENYMLHDGIHEGIVSETDWELAHQKREKTGVKYEKTHSLDHEHILSGILRCPLCGSGMYGNVNRKKKKDGTLYKDYFYYACKHRRLVDGHKCGYRKQWSEEKINNAVEEVIRKLVKNPKFEEAILNKIGSRIDTEEIEKEIERLEKQHRQLTGAKARLGQQMDSLDIMDKFYEKKYQDMETRLYRL